MKIYFPEYNMKSSPSKSPEVSPSDFSDSCRIVKLWSKADATERGKKYMRENGFEIEGNEMFIVLQETSTKKKNRIERFVVNEKGITKQ